MNSLQLFMSINIAFRDSFFYQEDSLIDTSISTIYKINLKAGKLKYVIPYIRTVSGIDSVKISFYEHNQKVERRYYTYKNEIFNIEYTFETSGEHQIEIENTVLECCLFARVLEQGLNTSSKNSYPNGYNNTSNISEITIISVGSFMSSFGPGCFSGVEVKFDYNNDYYNKFNAPTTIGYEAFSCKNINGDNYTIKLPYKTPDIKPLAFSNTNVPITLSFILPPSSTVSSSSIIETIEQKKNIHTWFDSTNATIEYKQSSENNIIANADKKMSLQQVDVCSHYFYNKDGYYITDGIFYADGNIGREGIAKRYNYFNIGIEQTKRQRLLYELKYCSYPNTTDGGYVQSIPIGIYESYVPVEIKHLMYKSGYNPTNGDIRVAYPKIEYIERRFIGYFVITINDEDVTLTNENNKNNWTGTVIVNDIPYYITIKIDVDENDRVCYILSDKSGNFNLISYDFEYPTTAQETQFIPSFTVTPKSIVLDSKAPYDNVDNATYDEVQTFAKTNLLVVNNNNIIREDKKLRRFSHTTFSGYKGNGIKLPTENYYLCFGIYTPYEYMDINEQQDYLDTFKIDTISGEIPRSIDYYNTPITIIRNYKLVDNTKIFINKYDVGEIMNGEKWFRGKFEPLFISTTSSKIVSANVLVDYYFGDYDDTIGTYKGVYIEQTIDKDKKQQYAFLPIAFPFIAPGNAASYMDDDGNIIEYTNSATATYNGNLVYYPVDGNGNSDIMNNRTISVRSFYGYKNANKGITKEQTLLNMNDIHAVTADGGIQAEPAQYEIEFTCLPSEF